MSQRVKFSNTSIESILWESKIKASSWDLLRHRLNYSWFIPFLVNFIYCSYFIFFGLNYGFKYEIWFFFIFSSAIFGIFFVPGFYKTFNFKLMYLTRKGLVIKTRFSGELFYPYGSFVIYSDAKSTYSRRVFTYEEITIFSPKRSKRTFIIPKKNATIKDLYL